MIHRTHQANKHEAWTSYKVRGAIWMAPPKPPSFKPIAHPDRLTGISCITKGNWLRWLVFRLMKPSARRRRMLNHI